MSLSCPPGTIVYSIQPGDTFFSLAARFGTTVNAIIAANPGVDPNRLQIGQVICIPVGGTSACPPGTRTYTIQPGDTYFALASRFGTTVNAIIAANPGVDPNRLQVGQVICIPTGTAPGGGCPSGTRAYTIQPGDTYFALASRFGTTVNAIIAANPGVDPNRLQVGQVICIPTGGTPGGGCPPGTRAYTIQPGDTYFALASRFGTTVNAIIAANPGVDPNRLQVGQVICIPGGGSTVVCPPGSRTYTIQPGDTLFRLAQTFNTTVNAIIAANPGIDPNSLRVGQIICIPTS